MSKKLVLIYKGTESKVSPELSEYIRTLEGTKIKLEIAVKTQNKQIADLIGEISHLKNTANEFYLEVKTLMSQVFQGVGDNVGFVDNSGNFGKLYLWLSREINVNCTYEISHRNPPVFAIEHPLAKYRKRMIKRTDKYFDRSKHF